VNPLQFPTVIVKQLPHFWVVNECQMFNTKYFKIQTFQKRIAGSIRSMVRYLPYLPTCRLSLYCTPLNFRRRVPLKVANLNQANILGRRIQQQRERVRAKAIRRGGGGQSSLWSKIQTPRQTRPPRRRNSRWKNLPKWQFITFFKMCM